jgi:hypothetical protein
VGRLNDMRGGVRAGSNAAPSISAREAQGTGLIPGFTELHSLSFASVARSDACASHVESDSLDGDAGETGGHYHVGGLQELTGNSGAMI